jgi:hypothetical protein
LGIETAFEGCDTKGDESLDLTGVYQDAAFPLVSFVDGIDQFQGGTPVKISLELNVQVSVDVPGPNPGISIHMISLFHILPNPPLNRRSGDRFLRPLVKVLYRQGDARLQRRLFRPPSKKHLLGLSHDVRER